MGWKSELEKHHGGFYMSEKEQHFYLAHFHEMKWAISIKGLTERKEVLILFFQQHSDLDSDFTKMRRKGSNTFLLHPSSFDSVHSLSWRIYVGWKKHAVSLFMETQKKPARIIHYSKVDTESIPFSKIGLLCIFNYKFWY